MFEEVDELKDLISKEEFCRLYGMSKDKLYCYALYKLGNQDDAEDAVSEAVLKAWKSIDRLRDAEAFEAWLFAILKFTCSDKIKGYIRDRERSEKVKANAISSSSFEPASLSLELSEALASLSEEDQEIVLLSVIGGFSGKEISDMTGLAAGTVRSKLSRSLSKMRDFLS